MRLLQTRHRVETFINRRLKFVCSGHYIPRSWFNTLAADARREPFTLPWITSDEVNKIRSLYILSRGHNGVVPDAKLVYHAEHFNQSFIDDGWSIQLLKVRFPCRLLIYIKFNQPNICNSEPEDSWASVCFKADQHLNSMSCPRMLFLRTHPRLSVLSVTIAYWAQTTRHS